MIPKNTQDPLLQSLRDYVEQSREVPTLDQIYHATNFRVQGPIGRLLMALQAVTAGHLRAVLGRTPTPPEGLSRADYVERIAAGLEADQGFDDGDGMLTVATPDQLRAALHKVLPA